MYPNLRKIKSKLQNCFKDFDLDTQINIFEFKSGSYATMDIVSDKWQGLSHHKRITNALKAIENGYPEFYEEYAIAVCPATRAEFADRTEERLHG